MFKILAKQLIYKIIEVLDNHSTPKDSEKLIESFDASGMEVLTDTGFKPISYFHKTKPYNIYNIKTESFSLDCADDHILFTPNMEEVFTKDLCVGDYVMTECGEEQILSTTIQDTSICMFDMTVADENHRLYTNGILSHNTTTSALFMLHYACTNIDKNCLVLGNKYKTAKEILDKIKNIFLFLPYHLKPGVKKWNESEIVFDNGCRIMAEATTINSGISFTYHCVLSDEFAHIAPNIVNKFYSNIFPTITAGKARFIISSTQNGFNLFYKLYKGAESGESEYKPFKVDWYQVPEWNPDTLTWDKRDERWKQLQIANLGGEDEFQMQFGTTFEITGNTLVSSQHIKKLQARSVEYKPLDMFDGEYWKFHPDIKSIDELKNKYIICTVDIAEGGGGDSSVISVWELTWDPRLEQEYCKNIGVMESNLITVEKLAEKTVNFICRYCNVDNVLLSHESNTYGKLYVKSINDYVNNPKSVGVDDWDDSVHVMYDKKLGFKMTSTSKKDSCKLFKYMTETNKIVNHYVKHTSQLECFVDDKGNETYSANYGHDDLVMTSVQLSPLSQTTQFKVRVNDMKEDYTNDEIKTSEDDYNVWDLNRNVRHMVDVNVWNF